MSDDKVSEQRLSEKEFYDRFAKIIHFVDEVGEMADGVETLIQNDNLTLEFANGSKIIISRQTPVRQIWVAAKSGGFHYDFHAQSGVWKNEKGGAELMAELEQLAKLQAGVTLTLR